jgi:hypothetical protein
VVRICSAFLSLDNMIHIYYLLAAEQILTTAICELNRLQILPLLDFSYMLRRLLSSAYNATIFLLRTLLVTTTSTQAVQLSVAMLYGCLDTCLVRGDMVLIH